LAWARPALISDNVNQPTAYSPWSLTVIPPSYSRICGRAMGNWKARNDE
jgi:hypothetical protein